MGDNLLLNSGAKISALIHNFTCGITKLPRHVQVPRKLNMNEERGKE